MKILWIVNIMFPEAQSLLDGEYNPIRTTGGWMIALSERLCKVDGVKLAVASLCTTVDTLTRINGEAIEYFLIPYGKGPLSYNIAYEAYWMEVKRLFDPDVVHIHGTEQSHGLSYVTACGGENVVASIQGLTSVYARYHHTGISITDIIKNWTFRDFIDGCTLRKEQNALITSGRYEESLIRKIKHVIGRTTWDKAHIWAINPQAQYHFCNETLRKEFYTDSWSYANCKKKSIFLSQAGTPIKGLYLFLKAAEIVALHYPELSIRIAGNNITQINGIKGKLAYKGYAKIINKWISKPSLKGRIVFLGPLDADSMKREYLSANVFVCPSTIENSPNSLGEAQLLGVPCISSYVGGTSDMIPDEGCGFLYRFEEYEMLAYHICEVFKNSNSFENQHMIDVARIRHNSERNTEDLLNIYYSICEN